MSRKPSKKRTAIDPRNPFNVAPHDPGIRQSDIDRVFNRKEYLITIKQVARAKMAREALPESQ